MWPGRVGGDGNPFNFPARGAKVPPRTLRVGTSRFADFAGTHLIFPPGALRFCQGRLGLGRLALRATVPVCLPDSRWFDLGRKKRF